MKDIKMEAVEDLEREVAVFCGEVAVKYRELTEIFAKHGKYLAAHKCSEKADTFSRCKTALEADKAIKLNDA